MFTLGTLEAPTYPRNGKGPTRCAVSEEVGTDVFRRQPDGSWKVARVLSYPSVP